MFKSTKFQNIYERFISVNNQFIKTNMEECSMASDMDDEEETWDIDWDDVIAKIESEIKKYDAPRISHDEILKVPMRY